MLLLRRVAPLQLLERRLPLFPLVLLEYWSKYDGVAVVVVDAAAEVTMRPWRVRVPARVRVSRGLRLLGDSHSYSRKWAWPNMLTAAPTPATTPFACPFMWLFPGPSTQLLRRRATLERDRRRLPPLLRRRWCCWYGDWDVEMGNKYCRPKWRR